MKDIDTEDMNRVKDNLAKSGTTPDEFIGHKLTDEEKDRLAKRIEELEED